MSIEKLKHVWPEWTIEKQLGKGSYGIVYKAVRRDHNLCKLRSNQGDIDPAGSVRDRFSALGRS